MDYCDFCVGLTAGLIHDVAVKYGKWKIKKDADQSLLYLLIVFVLS